MKSARGTKHTVVWLLCILLALLMAVPALAADFTYDDFSATLTVPDSYTMLTTSNLADHEDLLAKQGLTVEAAQADARAAAIRTAAHARASPGASGFSCAAARLFSTYQL